MADDGRELRVIEGDRADEAPLRRSVPTGEGRRCIMHRTFVLDHETRKVTCGDCDAEVTAFDALAQLEHELYRWQIAKDRERGEFRRIHAEVEDLKRQRRNLRAQIRRASA